MVINHGTVATHIPQSLPSFAQVFNNQSLSGISSANSSLPPIQTRLPPMEPRRVNSPPNRHTNEDRAVPRILSRKRSRNDVTSNVREEEQPNSDGSPRLVHIKEEDQDMFDPFPSPSRQVGQIRATNINDTPSLSTLEFVPSKKRRVTLSGPPHPLNTDVQVSNDQSCSTPISPVVMGFTIQRDNPSAIEQVKSMITVKQKQKALIEQRRGSVTGAMSPSTVTTNPIPSSPAQERNLPLSKPAQPRSTRRSPNTNTASRRPTNNPGQNAGTARPSSPTPITAPNLLQIPVATQITNANPLPPPPISFARRRAEQLGSGKKKPADILISPREVQTPEQFQPAIQSAPPVQTSFSSGRFHMALPRLPTVMGGGDNVRRVAGNVPPTPTRFSIQRNTPNMAHQSIPSIAGRSPSAPSVPIASTLVPPTPGFRHTDFSGDRAAFLSPFEVFYDALHDSKQLKTWLGDQIQRSNSLIQTLTQQQQKLNELVEGLVERKVNGMRSEMAGLHRRIEELEETLRTSPASHHNADVMGGTKPNDRTPLRNGIVSGQTASESYTFPSSSVEEPRRRPEFDQKLSPRQGHERSPRENQNVSEMENEPSASTDSTRMSMSTPRIDHSRTQHFDSSQPRSSFGMQATSQGLRNTPNHTLPPPATHGKPERPNLSRQSSTHGSSEQQTTVSPAIRRSDSRRNSVIKSLPDAPGDDG